MTDFPDRIVSGDPFPAPDSCDAVVHRSQQSHPNRYCSRLCCDHRKVLSVIEAADPTDSAALHQRIQASRDMRHEPRESRIVSRDPVHGCGELDPTAVIPSLLLLQVTTNVPCASAA